jgi:hypothetical protein
MIDLENPWFKFVVKENVEPQYFKTHAVLNIIRLATLISMGKTWLHHQQTFDNRVLNI